MVDYYTQHLSAARLHLCYKIVPQRIRQYLQAEIETVADTIKPDDFVLDLGCGYGRVLKELAKKTRNIVGVDLAFANLKYARGEYLDRAQDKLVQMDAVHLGFRSHQFDLVFCIQNGISAFGVSPSDLIAESIRVTRPGGIVLFSSYSPKIWKARLDWFRIQSEHGLIGEIDTKQTGNGIIVCKDGFKATTFDESDFSRLTAGLNREVKIFEVDQSALFCEIFV